MKNLQRVRQIAEKLAKATGADPPFDRVFEVLESEGVLDAFEKADRLDRKLELHREASKRHRRKQREHEHDDLGGELPEGEWDE